MASCLCRGGIDEERYNVLLVCREIKREVAGVVDVICIDMPFWWSVALIYISIVHADIGFYE